MTDPKFMQRALDLAVLGHGRVSPNPMVGCVIELDGAILGEGFHQQYGGAHAEVNAVASVPDKSKLRFSTVYVTLEPCSHFGKTPPCADLLIHHKVKKVVICNMDPNPLVSGSGIEKLKNAGIEVEAGLLAERGEALNKRFFTFHRKKRPYVILKWAQTADGFVARENFDSKWISNARSRQLVHKWRSEEASILVGKHTAIHDNPTLTVRDWSGKNPIRILIDPKLEVSPESNLLDQAVETLVFNTLKSESKPNLTFIQPPDLSPKAILDELLDRKLLSVFIEGGSKTIGTFLNANLWDEARVFTSETRFEKGIKAPEIQSSPSQAERILTDTLTTYFNPNG